jgi:hypothetical protein
MLLRRKQDVDACDTSAFTRVFDALCAGMTTERLSKPYMIRNLFRDAQAN